MANLLVLAAAAEAGDEVLIEEPTYSLLVDAARWLRLDVRRFPRRAEDAFRLDPRSRVPVLAIALQGAAASVIALSGRYEQILNYVVSVDFISMGLTGAALFVYRRRGEAGAFRAPGHPWTTAFFVLSCWLVVAATIPRYPGDSVIGLGILAVGLPVYGLWRPAAAVPGGQP
jgi:hypothetical protein